MIEFIVARDLLAPDSPAVTRVGDDDDDRRGEILEDGRRSWLVRIFMNESLTWKRDNTPKGGRRKFTKGGSSGQNIWNDVKMQARRLVLSLFMGIIVE